MSVTRDRFCMYLCTINDGEHDCSFSLSLSPLFTAKTMFISFPVESMVIRPEDGKVLSHVNANNLLDSTSVTLLETIMYVCERESEREGGERHFFVCFAGKTPLTGVT